MTVEKLSDYGCTAQIYHDWQRSADKEMSLARVTADYGTSLTIVLPKPITAEVNGKLAFYSKGQDTPKVGDWVSVRVRTEGNAVIESVIPRKSEIARKAPGNKTRKQVIAANVDLAFVLLAMDEDFNVERLKRYLYQLSASNVAAVIVLNKADKAEPDVYLQQLTEIDTPKIISNALTGLGVDSIRAHIKPGMTAILLGSSGVGKSTITNRLLGSDVQTTHAVRISDSSGMHTTVHRQLFMLPDDGMLIDSPGVREFQLWGTQDDLDDSYDDVSLLAKQCKYSSCQHNQEAGCAVRQAIDDNILDARRYASYQKMQSELKMLATKKTELQKLSNKRSFKKLRAQRREILERDRQDDIE